jgi:Arc/MetJ-type ribon-helix-helix transcriptional regulator
MTEERKKYPPLPDDAKRNKIGRKTRSKLQPFSAIINMSHATEKRMKQHTKTGGYRSYSEYVRYLIDELPTVTEETLVVNLQKTTMRNLKRNAEDLNVTIEAYIKMLSELQISK